jgi:RNA polymerase sigma-70 factor, ECF subfamily
MFAPYLGLPCRPQRSYPPRPSTAPDEEKLVSTEEIEIEIENMPTTDRSHLATSQNQALDRISLLIQRLKPIDRQIIVSYLEGLDANSTAEITGLSAANVAMKVHRIKNILKRWFHEGASHAG